MDESFPMQAGGIRGPNDAITHYEVRADADGRCYVEFGSEDIPGANPMYTDDMSHHLIRPYAIPKPVAGWRKLETFTADEKVKLRATAETLAMLDRNAFFGMAHGGFEHYEGYLPEAFALYESNGGDTGWAGEASFAKAAAK